MEEAFGALREFIRRHPRLFVLTGAGVSTDSGIPDYRDRDGQWKRPEPMNFRRFMDDPASRARYWARSMVGWRSFGASVPNAAHYTLSRWEQQQRIELLVTQNVDRLHQAAGAQNVVDLHGRLDRVRCMQCHHHLMRNEFQQSLETSNPAWVTLEALAAPDGDADLEGLDFDRFVVPSCPVCGGILKPDVVFFGEVVPPERVVQAMQALERADAMLVVGSSLMVYSGYRFATAAARLGRPIVAINLGHTRADNLLALKVEASCAAALQAVDDA